MDVDYESEDQRCSAPIKNDNASVNSRQEGHNSKPKRQMKTPFQLETLEKAYAVETYPSEATRTKLSKKLDLTDRQLQMWFCHRRLKDRKDDKRDVATTKKHHKAPTSIKRSPLLSESPIDQELDLDHNDPESAAGSDYESQCGSGFSSYAPDTKSVADLDVYMPMPQRYHEPPSLRSCTKVQTISYVESRLNGPLREDGPVLGFEFDPLPPDAFGVSIATMTEQYERNSTQRFGRHEGKMKKGLTKSLHGHGQLIQHSHVESPIDTISGRKTSKHHGSVQHFPRVSTTTKSSLVSYTSPRSKGSNHFLSSPNINDHDYFQHPESPFVNNNRNEKSRSNTIIKPKSTHIFRDAKVFQDDDDMRLRKKHKVNHLHMELDNALKT